MKTRKKMRTVLSIVVLMLMNLSFGQSEYLKITKSDKESDFIKYPPGSKFELTDASNKVVYSDKSSVKEFIIDKSYTLTVYPTYKTTSNIYYLNEGKIEIKSNAEYFKALEEYHVKKTSKKDYGYYTYDENHFTNGLKMTKSMKISSLDSKLYNATFKFNNGVEANYKDGKMTATQNGKKLKIEGYYLIYSEDGLIKLSFRPKTGETWWVFEPKKK